MGHAGDAAQRVTGFGAGRVHLSDDCVFGPRDRGERRHRCANAVAAVVDQHRIQRARRIGDPQFGVLGE
jgi:hypothetical protein